MFGRFSLFLAAACIVSSVSAIPFVRNCQDVKVVDNFNVDKFMGTWYVYSGFPTVHTNEQKCQTEIYEKKGDGYVEMKSYSYVTKTGAVESYKTTARLASPGKFTMTFTEDYPKYPNYFVLGTDYANYAVVYNCMEIGQPGHTEMLWILTRERVPSVEHVHAAEEVVKQHHFPTNSLYPIDQRNCPAAVQPIH